MREKISATLYCITVTDDLDPKISETTKIDKENIRDFFGTAAYAINLNIKNISIEGSRFNLSNVESMIRSLRVKPNDVIVFSYSGHGFSYSKDPLYRFPQLALWHGNKNAAFFRKNSINLQTIFYRLRAKGARLTIVLGDCCNTDAGITREIDEPPPISAMMGPMPPYLRRNYLRLLMETEGAYIACAAQKGEPAAGDIYKGGFFTYNFTSIIERRILKEAEIDPATIWYSVLESTSNAAASDAARLFCREFNGPCRQTSVYKKVSSKSVKAKR